MSQNETVLYPADFDENVPPQAELVLRLVKGGFMVESPDPHQDFELSKTFMDSSELGMYERNGRTGQRVTVTTYDVPQLFTSSHIQYVEKVVSPTGTTWGDGGLVQAYLQQLYEDSEASALDPASGQEHLIRSLRFEYREQQLGQPLMISAAGYGRAAISITGFRTRNDCRLDEVAQMVGFALEHCYLGG